MDDFVFSFTYQPSRKLWIFEDWSKGSATDEAKINGKCLITEKVNPTYKALIQKRITWYRKRGTAWREFLLLETKLIIMPNWIIERKYENIAWISRSVFKQTHQNHLDVRSRERCTFTLKCKISKCSKLFDSNLKPAYEFFINDWTIFVSKIFSCLYYYILCACFWPTFGDWLFNRINEKSIRASLSFISLVYWVTLREILITSELGMIYRQTGWQKALKPPTLKKLRALSVSRKNQTKSLNTILENTRTNIFENS